MRNEPTGRVRMREQKRWFRPSLLVLQVEVRIVGLDYDGMGGTLNVDATVWRDATAEDLCFDVKLFNVA